MRNILKSTSEVCHYWGNQVQSSGRAGNVFFEAEKIYSYGRHFCMARILPSGVVAFTNRGYSNSTSKHLGKARSAVSHRAMVYCNDPSDSARVNMAQACKIALASFESADAPRLQAKTRLARKAHALCISEQANTYLAALPENEREGVLPIDVSGFEALKIQIEAQRVIDADKLAKRNAVRFAEIAEHLAVWRAGGNQVHSGYSFYQLPAALRIKGDIVQTSHGADIPVADALKLWPVIQRTMKGSRDFEPGTAIGSYRLTKIRRDGSIVVGCHDIAFTEIDNMAVALGLKGGV